MELELECFWHTYETSQADKLGMEYNLEDAERRKITFYEISAIGIHEEKDGKKYGKIYFNGDHIISCYSYKELKRLIHDHNDANIRYDKMFSQATYQVPGPR